MTSRFYLMKSDVSDPVVIVRICGDAMRQIKPVQTKRILSNRHVRANRQRSVQNKDLHVSPGGFEDVSFYWIHYQDGGLLNGTQTFLLVNGIVIKRAAEER